MNEKVLKSLDVIAREKEQEDWEEEDLIRIAAQKQNQARYAEQYPQFPQPTFLVGISGQWGRGKSTLLIMLQMLMQQFDLFNEVFFFSGSGTKDQKMKHFFPHDNPDTSTTPSNLLSIIKRMSDDSGMNELLGTMEKKFGMKSAPATTTAGGQQQTSQVNQRGIAGRMNLHNQQTKKNPGEGMDPKVIRNIIRKSLGDPRRRIDELDDTTFGTMTPEEKTRFLRKMITSDKLFVFDDSSGDDVLKQNSPYYPVIVMLRHINASGIFTYHSWKDLPKKIRNQTSTNIVFPSTPAQHEAIGEESGLGPKTADLIFSAMRRLKHVYLVIHDRPLDNHRYWLNFRVPLTESDITEVAEAEATLRSSQRGTKKTIDLHPTDTEQGEDVGGTPILSRLLEGAPDFDELHAGRPLPSKKYPLALTSRESKVLPKAKKLVARVETITYPLVPDPSKLLPLEKDKPKRKATPKKRKRKSGSLGPANFNKRRTQRLDSVQMSRLDPVRPSSRAAVHAAAQYLHPSYKIANLARNRALAAGGRGLAVADAQEARKAGDPSAAALAARAAAAKRNPKVARLIGKQSGSSRRPNIRAIARGVQRSLLQGIRGARLSSRGFGPRGAVERVVARARSKPIAGRRMGGGSLDVLGALAGIQGRLQDANTTLRAQQERIAAIERGDVVPPRRPGDGTRERAQKPEKPPSRPVGGRTGPTPTPQRPKTRDTGVNPFPIGTLSGPTQGTQTGETRLRPTTGTQTDSQRPPTIGTQTSPELQDRRAGPDVPPPSDLPPPPDDDDDDDDGGGPGGGGRPTTRDIGVGDDDELTDEEDPMDEDLPPPPPALPPPPPQGVQTVDRGEQIGVQTVDRGEQIGVQSTDRGTGPSTLGGYEGTLIPRQPAPPTQQLPPMLQRELAVPRRPTTAELTRDMLQDNLPDDIPDFESLITPGFRDPNRVSQVTPRAERPTFRNNWAHPGLNLFTQQRNNPQLHNPPSEGPGFGERVGSFSRRAGDFTGRTLGGATAAGLGFIGSLARGAASGAAGVTRGIFGVGQEGENEILEEMQQDPRSGTFPPRREITSGPSTNSNAMQTNQRKSRRRTQVQILQDSRMPGDRSGTSPPRTRSGPREGRDVQTSSPDTYMQYYDPDDLEE